jgi:tetratricopeptide (TPR) repeat protein
MTASAPSVTASVALTGDTLTQAQNHRDRGNWHRARRLAARAIRFADDSTSLLAALEELALIQRATGRTHPALCLLRLVAELHQQQGRAVEARGHLRLVTEILLDAERITEAQEALDRLGYASDTLTLWGRLYAAQGETRGLRRVTAYLRQREAGGWPPGVPLPVPPQVPPPPKPAASADELLLLATAAEDPDQAQGYWRLAYRSAAEAWDVWAMQRVDRARSQIGGLTA